MESLALVVSLIIGGIVLAGMVSVVVAVRPGRRRGTRSVGALAGFGALSSGMWLTGVVDSPGARLIGGAAALAGAGALWRLWSSRRRRDAAAES